MSIKISIINYLLLKIQQGEYLVGDKLPSEQALAIKFNCNRHTARAALMPLRNSGMIELMPGRGNVLKYSLMQLYAPQININHNNYKIFKISFKQLPIPMLQYYANNNPCFKEIYYFNAKTVGYTYVVLTNNLIIENRYSSLFELFSYYGIVIKKVTNNIEVISNQGRYLEVKSPLLVKVDFIFYSNNQKIEAIVTLIANAKFFKGQSFSKIF